MAVQQLPPGFTKRQVRATLRQSHAQFRALEEAWETLLNEHEGEWVATFDAKFVFGKTIEEALKAAKRRRWPLDRIAIDYLTADRQAILL